MDTLSRRKFIKLTGASAVAAAAPSLSISQIAEAAISRPLPAGTPILVVVTLYGGNDGLNTVVPYQDMIYHQLRPQLAYKESEVIPLGEGLALNGSMTGFKNLWDQKKLAIVRGVGYPNSDRSHFSSMAIWQSGMLNANRTGWLGRWVDTQVEDPFLAIGLGSVLPPLLAGEKRSGSVLPLGGLKIPKGSLASDCAKLSIVDPKDDEFTAAAARAMRNLFQVSSEVTPILKEPAITVTDLPTVVGGNAGGDSDLSTQLEIVAKLIAAGAPTKIWSVSLGGFDTHADEHTAQSKLLGAVSGSISKFMAQISKTSRGKDVTVLIYSEFGRRVRANASQGTDHGTSGPVFLIGEMVRGGFHGEQPSLRDLKDDDLLVTTDFRDIYGTVLEDILKIPSERIINRSMVKLDLFN